MQDFAAKVAEHAARIAGVLTIVEDFPATTISVEAMRSGLTLADWYMNEAVRLQQAARTDPKLLAAQKMLDWLRERGKDVIALREIMQFGPSPLRTKNGTGYGAKIRTGGVAQGDKMTADWTPVFVLPNIPLQTAIGCDVAAIAPAHDPRVAAFKRAQPLFRRFLNRFSDNFSQKFEPAVFVVRPLNPADLADRAKDMRAWSRPSPTPSAGPTR